MSEHPAQWLPMAAIPLLLVVGTLSVLHWSRYLEALNQLHHLRTAPGAAPSSSATARLELGRTESYRQAYRLTWAVVVVLAVGLAAAVLVG